MDVPSSFSNTSYYAGRREGDLSDGPVPGAHGRAPYGPAYGVPSNSYGSRPGTRPEPWTAPTQVDPRGYGESAGPDEVDPRTYVRPSRAQERRAARQRGLPAWGALLVLIGISGVGGIIDTVSGNNIRGGFNIALVVASIVAILLVRHRDMFPIVVAPPLVYIVASGVVLYVRSGGLHDRKVLIDAAANWLVYGFPAIAGASAAVLIIAGIRLISGK